MLDSASAATELLRRRSARGSLIEYSQSIMIPGAPVAGNDDQFAPIETRVAVHHRLLMATLQRISETPGGRAMVFMPPGSAKSTYSSVVFPTWVMGRKPGTQIILGSYATDLARKHGKRARQVVSSPEFQNLFGTALAVGSSAADQWALANGSEYMAAGLLAGLTGNRADGLVIDDPVAGREEAESEAIRVKTLDAYRDDARTRLKPGGWRVIVATRWHQDDLAGSILPENWNGESGVIHCRDGHDWEVICLPAIADRSDDPLGRALGEGLWPEWFKPGHWEEFKFPPRSWLSLYQQKPTSEDGTYFKREWMRYYTECPAHLTVYMSGDFAVTDSGGDFTELAVWGVDSLGSIYVLDWWAGQTSADVWVKVLVEKAARFKPVWFIGEGGPIRRAIEPILNREMDEQRHWVACEWFSGGDKASNARSFQALCSVGKILFPRTEWAERVVDQMMRFPNGKHDDAVDTCGLFGRFIDRTWKATEPKKRKEVSWDQPMAYKDFEPRRNAA
jgi:predicted phage terminase large subunit-like protein